MIYYIDGYNYFFHFEKDENKTLLEGRNEVIKELSIYSKKISLVIVFDAHAEAGLCSKLSKCDAEIVYTSFKETADDYILERVSLAAEPAKICVVSEDKSLLKKAKYMRAKTCSIISFLSYVQSKISSPVKEKSTKGFGAAEYNYYLENFKK